MARLYYLLSNSCKEGLVGSPLQWPGVSAAAALYRGEWTMRGIWYDRTAEHADRLRGIKRQHPSVETVRKLHLGTNGALSVEYMIIGDAPACTAAAE